LSDKKGRVCLKPIALLSEVRRLFGRPAGGNHDTWQTAASLAQPFDFETTQRVKPRGHVVAVRVTSEDPEDGFKPTSGRIQELSFKGRPDVWAYFSVKVGSAYMGVDCTRLRFASKFR
jgi:acetyl-CoA carboxylase/biotin carboxylase 1